MFKLGLYREIKNINILLKCLIQMLKKDIKVLKSTNLDIQNSKPSKF